MNKLKTQGYLDYSYIKNTDEQVSRYITSINYKKLSMKINSVTKLSYSHHKQVNHNHLDLDTFNQIYDDINNKYSKKFNEFEDMLRSHLNIGSLAFHQESGDYKYLLYKHMTKELSIKLLVKE